MTIKSFLLPISVFLAGVFLGVVVSRQWGFQLPQRSFNNTNKTLANNLFTSQNAAVSGEITQKKGNILVVKNRNGQSGEFPIAVNFKVYKRAGNEPIAHIFAGLDQVSLNQPVDVLFELADGQYRVVSLQYKNK